MLLKDICLDMHQGINTVADKVVYINKGIPIIQSKNITSGFLDLNDVRFLCEEDYKKYKEKYQPNIGDLLISNIGTIGKSIIVKEKSDFLIAWNIFILKIDSNLINSDFLKYYLDYLNNNKYYDQFLTGGTVKFINKKNMENIPIPDLSIHEQLKIATNLEKISNMIDIKKNEINKLNDLIKSQFVEMFSNCSNERFIGDLISISRGASPRPINDYITNSDEGVNWIKIGDVSENSLYITSTKEKITEAGAEKSRRVCKGDFILSNSMSFGRPYILKIDGCVHDGWLIMSNFSDYFDEMYLYYSLRDDYVQKQFNGKVNGATVKNLNSDLVKKTYIKVPPMDQQIHFSKIVHQIDKQKLEFEKQLKKLEELQISLMQEYFG